MDDIKDEYEAVINGRQYIPKDTIVIDGELADEEIEYREDIIDAEVIEDEPVFDDADGCGQPDELQDGLREIAYLLPEGEEEEPEPLPWKDQKGLSHEETRWPRVHDLWVNKDTGQYDIVTARSGDRGKDIHWVRVDWESERLSYGKMSVGQWMRSHAFLDSLRNKGVGAGSPPSVFEQVRKEVKELKKINARLMADVVRLEKVLNRR